MKHPQRWTALSVEPHERGGFVAYSDVLKMLAVCEAADKWERLLNQWPTPATLQDAEDALVGAVYEWRGKPEGAPK